MSAPCRLPRKWLLHWITDCTSEGFSQNIKVSFLIKNFPPLLSRLCLDCSLCCSHHIMVMTIITSTSNNQASAEGCSVQTNHIGNHGKYIFTCAGRVFAPEQLCNPCCLHGSCYKGTTLVVQSHNPTTNLQDVFCALYVLPQMIFKGMRWRKASCCSRRLHSFPLAARLWYPSCLSVKVAAFSYKLSF